MIIELRNTATGEIAPAHRIGETEDGRALIQFVEGWEPVAGGEAVALESDQDGNWIADA